MRKLVIGMVAVGLVMLGAVLPLVLPWRCPVNRAAYERIKVGMTRAEVEQILTAPAGDYQTRPRRQRHHGDMDRDEGELYVYCDADIVEMADFFPASPADTGLLELLQWRLGRLMARMFP